MDFLISGQHINPIYLVVVGFAIGVMGGFFGVGGSFLAGPALFAAGLPMNFVVGTDMAHMVGKSIVAARKHRTLGNVDLKLGGIMVVGTIAGVETGAQVIQWLKRTAHIDWAVGLTFVAVLLAISGFMAWESIKTLRSHGHSKASLKPLPGEHPSRRDHSAMAHIARRIHAISIPPY